MKDHQPIFSRGSKYVQSAVNNWSKRSSRLIEAWYACNSATNKKRFENLIFVLRHRTTSLLKMLNEFHETQKLQDREQDKLFIQLECPNFQCKSNAGRAAIAVKINHVEDREYTCNSCGRTLIMRETRNMEAELAAIGIAFSR